MKYFVASTGRPYGSDPGLCEVAAVAELRKWVEWRYPGADPKGGYFQAVREELLSDFALRIYGEVFQSKMPNKERQFFLSPDGTEVVRRDAQPLV